MEVRLTLGKAGIISYLLNFARIGFLILLSLQFAKTFLYSKENLQSPSNVVINKLSSNFKQKQPIIRSFSSPKNIYYVFVTATALNLRSGPGVDNSVLRVLPRGTHMFSLSAKNSEWLRVFAQNNFKGWVARKHVIFYHPKPLTTIYDKINSMHFRSLLEVSILNYIKEN